MLPELGELVVECEEGGLVEAALAAPLLLHSLQASAQLPQLLLHLAPEPSAISCGGGRWEGRVDTQSKKAPGLIGSKGQFFRSSIPNISVVCVDPKLFIPDFFRIRHRKSFG
jgi:hypothetical protein